MADWRKVMFCNESTSRLVLRGYKLVRRPSRVSRYDYRYIIKTVKHPKSVMVWGDFSGDKGRGQGWQFLPLRGNFRKKLRKKWKGRNTFFRGRNRRSGRSGRNEI